jgi:hypothetical protein
MNAGSGSSAFKASTTPSPGARTRVESIWQFLERSTEPVAVETRRRWDIWLSQLPPDARAALITRLEDRHNHLVRAALAELITFVLLDATYPAVEIEPESGTGSRTDFAVDQPVRIHFEVYRKEPPWPQTANAKVLAAISDELEKIESPDFWLDVDSQSGVRPPAMRSVRTKVERWLASLDYDEQVRLHERERQARRLRMAGEMPGLDASPLERARYIAAHQPWEPESFEDSGDDWSIRITAYPRSADARGPGQFTVGLRGAGEAHIENRASMETAVRDKLKQHSGLTDPLVLVLDLSSPIIDDQEIAAMLYGPLVTTMLDPATVLRSERDRTIGIWREPLTLPPRPAAVLVLRGIWLDCSSATTDLWVPPVLASPVLPGPWNTWSLVHDDELAVEAAGVSITDVLNHVR